MAKITVELEKNETIEEIKEELAKSLAGDRKHTDPILQHMNDVLDKDYKKLHDGLIRHILDEIQKSEDPLNKLEKLYKAE